MAARVRHNDALQSQTGHLRHCGVALQVVTLVDGDVGVPTSQRSAELAAEARRDERIDERVHARVGVRQDARGDVPVVERVRVTPRRREEVGPEPDDVRRQPAGGEDGDDDNDESRHSLFGYDRLTLGWSTITSRLRRPKPADSQRAENANQRHWNGVVNDEKNEEAGRAMPPERVPVISTDQ